MDAMLNLPKPHFFLSNFITREVRERGNTHYCFHCGGLWGFTPGENGEPTNHLDSRITLRNNEGKKIFVKEALQDENLEPCITDGPGYPRHEPGDKQYDTWLNGIAIFDYDPTFVRWCEERWYVVCRRNPMREHDPVAHTDRIVSRAEGFDFAGK